RAVAIHVVIIIGVHPALDGEASGAETAITLSFPPPAFDQRLDIPPVDQFEEGVNLFLLFGRVDSDNEPIAQAFFLAKLFEGAWLMVAGVGVNSCPVTVGVDFSPGGGLIELDLDG